VLKAREYMGKALAPRTGPAQAAVESRRSTGVSNPLSFIVRDVEGAEPVLAGEY
jgi:hypothetical protein